MKLCKSLFYFQNLLKSSLKYLKKKKEVTFEFKFEYLLNNDNKKIIINSSQII